jgi:hypothetical protein
MFDTTYRFVSDALGGFFFLFLPFLEAISGLEGTIMKSKFFPHSILFSPGLHKTGKNVHQSKLSPASSFARIQKICDLKKPNLIS